MTSSETSDSFQDETALPVIIPRSDHPISRRAIDREALKVLYRLKDAGYLAYLVGGGVRDLYLGKQPKDFDIGTNARPGQIRKLFQNSRIIGKRFRLVQILFRGGKVVEISTFRKRSEFVLEGEEAVLGPNNTFGTPMEDAFRRDLTINALFYDIESLSVIDYTGGVSDLDLGIIRVVGEPGKRFIRDPVRMMRAIRHAARNDFAVEETTWQAIEEHRDKLRVCPVSRVRDELFKDLKGGASRAWARLALASGLFFVLFPAYRELVEDGKAPAGEPFDLMLALLGVVDRLHGLGRQLPEPLLLAALLLPWTLAKSEETGQPAAKTGQAALVKDLGTRLESMLGPLDIKRSVKDSLATLLGFFPVFALHAKEQQWPKRLMTKSYFQDCLFLHQLFEEAGGGAEVDPGLVRVEPKPQPRRRTRRFGHRGPAFAKKTKGGIFGLKK